MFEGQNILAKTILNAVSKESNPLYVKLHAGSVMYTLNKPVEEKSNFYSGTGYAALPDPLAVQPGLEDGDVLELVRWCQKGVFAQNDKV